MTLTFKDFKLTLRWHFNPKISTSSNWMTIRAGNLSKNQVNDNSKCLITFKLVCSTMPYWRPKTWEIRMQTISMLLTHPSSSQWGRMTSIQMCSSGYRTHKKRSKRRQWTELGTINLSGESYSHEKSCTKTITILSRTIKSNNHLRWPRPANIRLSKTKSILSRRPHSKTWQTK